MNRRVQFTWKVNDANFYTITDAPNIEKIVGHIFANYNTDSVSTVRLYDSYKGRTYVRPDMERLM